MSGLGLLSRRVLCFQELQTAGTNFEAPTELVDKGAVRMECIEGLLIWVLLLSLVSKSVIASSNDFLHCETIVKEWAESSRDDVAKEDKFNLKDLLFFLHVPRTGGRTYFHCFLRKLYTSSQECPRSYDKLRFDPRKSNCRLMVTHDDYSLMSKLPKEKTSVVTVLRNPIDRVFSTYEFSVEVAARFLVHPNLTSATQMSVRLRPKSLGRGVVSTLDIWPWKYLVPWMRQDLFSRRDVRKFVTSRSNNIGNSPYDMEDMVMPLHQFINDPIAHEIVHNGATFQVAGLTNNSYIEESHKIRQCVRKHPVLGQYVLEIAKSRLDHMLYVGLTEDHKESATIFANMVGAQVLSQSEALSTLQQKASNETEMSSDATDPSDEAHEDQHSTSSQHSGIHSPARADKTNRSMTVGELMEAYEACISSLRKAQGARRTMSLKGIAPANFTKEARLQVPEKVLQEILSLNSLDVELYKHAQDIFLQQQKHLMQKNQAILNWQHDHLSSKAVAELQYIDSEGCTPWKIFSLTISAFVLVIFLVLTAKRRTSKIKL